MKRKLIYLLSAVLLLTVFSVQAPQNVLALKACDTVESCEAEQVRIKAEKDALKSELDANEATEKSLIKEIEGIIDSIKLAEENIEVLNTTIEKLEKRIEELDKDIIAKEDVILDRLASEQVESKQNVYLSLLMSSSTLTDLMKRIDMLEIFNAADKKLVDELDAKKQQQLEAKEKDETSRTELVEEKDSLKSLEAEQKTKLADLQETLEKNHSDYNALTTSEEEINYQKAILEGGVPSSNGWYIPAKRGVLTCGVNCYSGHIGVDFGMSVGTPIYAAATGKVVYTDTGYTGFAKGSFGNMVAISHNVNGTLYVTIYAHMTSVHVSPGDIVTGGTQIGTSGETGEAYGPHLHIEVLKDIDTFYYDKSIRIAHHINPLNVLPNPGSWQW